MPFSLRETYGENVVRIIATLFLDWIFIKLTDNGNTHKILDNCDFSVVWTIGMIVTRPSVSHRIGKCCADDSDFILMGKRVSPIITKVAGNQDRHENSGKLDFWSSGFYGPTYSPQVF